jgi:hypothetical protein
LKEKGDLIDRTTDSINKFSENMKRMPEQSGVQSGGGVRGISRKYKKDKNKTKRVRFNL